MNLCISNSYVYRLMYTSVCLVMCCISRCFNDFSKNERICRETISIGDIFLQFIVEIDMKTEWNNRLVLCCRFFNLFLRDSEVNGLFFEELTVLKFLINLRLLIKCHIFRVLSYHAWFWRFNFSHFFLNSWVEFVS